MSDRLVLALDGSTRVCGAALLRLRSGAGSRESRWETVTRRVEIDSRGQAKILLRLVDEMIGETGDNPESLGAIIVGIGPGTFTGVRITVATARALSLALSVPVLGVSTLGALAAGAASLVDDAIVGAAPPPPAPRLLVPVVDARRDQVFFGLYGAIEGIGGSGGRRWGRSAEFGVCDREALGGLVAEEVARRLEADRERDGGHFPRIALVVGEDRVLAGRLPAGVVFTGAGVEAERLVMGQERLDEPGDALQGARLTPWLAETLAAGWPAAPSSGGADGPGTPETVKPIYVRSPDADIHITKMRDPWADSRGEP
jgi:tRNA threonylcarbamoyl adenosine modification protein YeaZ